MFWKERWDAGFRYGRGPVILEKGQHGHTYNVGRHNERINIDILRQIPMNRLQCTDAPCHELVSFVTDRPEHDQRYAIDATNWKPISDTAMNVRDPDRGACVVSRSQRLVRQEGGERLGA